MTQITNTKKIVAGLMSFAMVFGAVVVPAAKADAQTTTTTTTTTSASMYTRDLTVGSRGADVTSLQAMLAAGGHLKVAPTGYFGPLTKGALAAWQMSVGITPAAGYFGPITRAYIATSGSVTVGTGTLPAGCSVGSMYSTTTGMPCTTTSAVPGCMAGAKFSSTTGQPCTGGSTTTTTTTLSGTDGSISDVSELSQYSNEEVGEGEDEVQVLGFEVEASNDGDIALRSIKVEFDPAGNTGSENLDDYISGVKVWQGSKEIGSADVDDFSEDDNDIYTRTITLSNSVVKADVTEKFYISVDGANTFDSGDINGTNDSWTVDVENIRYVDGSGVTSTEEGYDLGSMDVAMNFVTFADSADTELKISKDSSSPDAGIVVVDDSDTTDDVVLLKGKIEVEGDSDVTIDELPITLTTTGDSLAAVASNLILTIGSDSWEESVSTTTTQSASITFDDMDFTIDAGKIVSFTITGDINDIENTGVQATDFDEGDTLKASLTSTNLTAIDADDEEGDQLGVTSSDRSGSATGEEQEFRTNGIDVDLVGTPSATATTGNAANDDAGTFTIKFKVTAVGDTVYISSLADAVLTGNTDGKTSVKVDRSGTATVGGVSTVLTNIDDTDLNAAGLYVIEDGESETFELTTSVQLPTSGTAGLYRAVLSGIRWTTDASDATPSNSYTSDLDMFKTSYISLN